MLHGIGNWENNNEISMLSTALNRLRLHCITATIQRRTKNLGNWLIFPRWQGKLFQDIDVKRAPVYYFWDALRIRRHASILNEAILWIEGNAILDGNMCEYVCTCIYIITVFPSFPDQRIFPKSRFIYSVFTSFSPRLFFGMILIIFISRNFTTFWIVEISIKILTYIAQ